MKAWIPHIGQRGAPQDGTFRIFEQCGCCSNPMDSFAPDAVKLTPEEAKTYVDQMQGMTLFVKKTNLLIYVTTF